MTRIAKLFDRVANQRYRPKFAELQSLIEAAGYRLERTRGSHRQYRHPDVPAVLTVQPNGNMAQDYQVRDFLAKVREYDLWSEDQ